MRGSGGATARCPRRFGHSRIAAMRFCEPTRAMAPCTSSRLAGSGPCEWARTTVLRLPPRTTTQWRHLEDSVCRTGSCTFDRGRSVRRRCAIERRFRRAGSTEGSRQWPPRRVEDQRAVDPLNRGSVVNRHGPLFESLYLHGETLQLHVRARFRATRPLCRRPESTKRRRESSGLRFVCRWFWHVRVVGVSAYAKRHPSQEPERDEG
jgi:hypothetical protein